MYSCFFLPFSGQRLAEPPIPPAFACVAPSTLVCDCWLCAVFERAIMKRWTVRSVCVCNQKWNHRNCNSHIETPPLVHHHSTSESACKPVTQRFIMVVVSVFLGSNPLDSTSTVFVLCENLTATILHKSLAQHVPICSPDASWLSAGQTLVSDRRRVRCDARCDITGWRCVKFLLSNVCSNTQHATCLDALRTTHALCRTHQTPHRLPSQ